MSNERRYDDDEVRRIFEAATHAEATRAPVPGGRAPTSDGLTLDELRRIGAEVGLEPALVTEAALGLGRSTSGLPERTGRGPSLLRTLGLPVAVEHRVELARRPSDDEWGRLVAHLRRTFSASGRISVVGRTREWRNGNLFVVVTPTPHGARLEMGTRKGSARGYARAAAWLLATSAILVVVMALTGRLGEAGALMGPAVLAAFGVGIGLASAGSLPIWARTRARQLEEVGEVAAQLTAGTPSREGPG